MAADGFKSAGLGLMNVADEYARKGMAGSSDRKGEFLGGLLSFLGVGQDTQQNLQNNIKDFRTNPIAALGPKITSDMYGVSPSAMGPAMPPSVAGAAVIPNTVQPAMSVQQPIVGAAPVAGAPAVVDPLELERQKTQNVLNSLIPRNLANQ